MSVCNKCAKETNEPESCWYCTDDLCSDCWEEWGHCGHYQAYEKNAKVHIARIAELEAENKKLQSLQKVCGVCWTSSFEPTEDGERCLCCWQHKSIIDLMAENKRLRESEGLIEFVGCMLDEIEANKEKKGDWKEWSIVPEKVSHEFIWHQGKLFDALVSKDQEGILEYCADIANLAYFVAVNTDALSKDKT